MTFYPVLHGLRGLAAMAVLLFHWKGSFPKVALDLQSVSFLGTEWDLFFFINLGWNGVHWFFVLSGFLLASKLMEHPRRPIAVADFWQRRVARIYPAVWVQLTILLSLNYATGLMPVIDWKLALGNFMLWPEPLPGGVRFYNGVYWTLPLELSFYLVLPFIVMLDRRIGFWPVLLGGLAVMLGWRLGVIAWHDLQQTKFRLGDVRHVLPGMLFIFMAGYALTRFPQQQTDRTRYLLLALAITGYVAWHQWLVAATRSGQNESTLMLLVWEAGLGLWIAAIVGLLLRPLRGFGWLGSRPLTWLGDISYGIYLWHFPVLRLLPRYWPSENWHTTEGSLLALAICLVITLPLAVMSYHWVERPILEAVARRQQRRRGVQSV